MGAQNLGNLDWAASIGQLKSAVDYLKSTGSTKVRSERGHENLTAARMTTVCLGPKSMCWHTLKQLGLRVS